MGHRWGGGREAPGPDLIGALEGSHGSEVSAWYSTLPGGSGEMTPNVSSLNQLWVLELKNPQIKGGRLIRLSLAHVVLQDNGELQPRRLKGNVYL